MNKYQEDIDMFGTNNEGWYVGIQVIAWVILFTLITIGICFL